MNKPSNAKLPITARAALIFAFAASVPAPAAAIWVSSQSSSGTVTAYDSTSGAVLGQIAHTFDNPVGLTTDAAGNLYISEYGANTIWEFNATTASLTPFISLPSNSGPFDLAFDAAGNVYVAELSAGEVDKYTSGGAFVASTSIPLARGITYNSSDGNLYVLSDQAANQVYMLTTGLVASPFITTGMWSPRYLTFDPANGFLFVSNTGSGANGGFIESYNGTTDLGNYIGGLSGPNGMAFDPTGSTLYFAGFFAGDVRKSTGIGSSSALMSGIPDANGLAYSTFMPNFVADAPNITPEPVTYGMFLSGLGAMALLRRLRRR